MDTSEVRRETQCKYFYALTLPHTSLIPCFSIYSRVIVRPPCLSAHARTVTMPYVYLHTCAFVLNLCCWSRVFELFNMRRWKLFVHGVSDVLCVDTSTRRAWAWKKYACDKHTSLSDINFATALLMVSRTASSCPVKLHSRCKPMFISSHVYIFHLFIWCCMCNPSDCVTAQYYTRPILGYRGMTKWYSVAKLFIL